MLTEAHEFIYHEMLVHVPLFSHPDPRRVLIVGGGDGGTAREVLKHESVKRVDMVEIDEEVVKVSKRYLPDLACELDNPRLKLTFQDAVEFIKDKVELYDIVLVDSTDPIGPGEGLFNRSFYRDVYRSLKANGIISVQSESPFSIAREVPQIFGKLSSVFPAVHLYWCPIPCYPYGTWSFTFGSKDRALPQLRRSSAVERMERALRYYNREIHRACFILPNFMRELCREKD
jgi:spermidine synthase